MSKDYSDIQLPPPGVALRLPPKNKRELTADEAYQQVRRHLKDDEGGEGTVSVQMKAQIKSSRAEQSSVRAAS